MVSKENKVIAVFIVLAFALGFVIQPLQLGVWNLIIFFTVAIVCPQILLYFERRSAN